MATTVASEGARSAVEDSDEDFDLFGDQSDGASADFQRNLQQRAELARREKLAKLPPQPQRTSAQSRTAYVLSGRRLQPTRLPSVLSADECELVIAAVVDHVRRRGGLQTDRHDSFATTDVPVRDLSLAHGTASRTVGDVVLDWVSERVLTAMASATGFRPPHLGLKDLFVVCYCGEKPLPKRGVVRYPIPSKQASLAIHSDGCLLSFSLLLNHQDAFDGGGTFFKGTGKTYHVEQGGLLMHDAGLERKFTPRTVDFPSKLVDS